MLHRALLPGPTDRADLKRAALAGLLMGLALCAKSWPIWLIPGMLLLLPNLRARIAALFTTGVLPVFFLVTLPVFAGTSIEPDPRGHRDHPRHPADHRRVGLDRPHFTGGDWALDAGLASVGTT